MNSHRKTASTGTARQATHTSSMKSIESSMVALSVSLSSYLTNNRGAADEEEEPVVKAVVISTKNKTRRTEEEESVVKKPRKRREHPRVDNPAMQEPAPRKTRVQSHRQTLKAEKSMLMQKLEEMAQAVTSYKGHKVKASRHEEALRNKKGAEPVLQTLLETKYLKAEEAAL